MPSTRPPRLPVGTTITVAALLVIPLVALALVPTYSHEKPTVWGFPFFYWYQILWVFITPLLTFLAIVAGLYTRWFHRWALLVGWAVGIVTAYRQTVPNASTRLVDGKPVTTVDGKRHFGSSLAKFPGTDTTVCIAATALLLNIVVAVVLTLVLRAIKAPAGVDETAADDYYSDSVSPDLVAAEEKTLTGHEA